MTAGMSGTAQAFQAVDWRATALLPRCCYREEVPENRRESTPGLEPGPLPSLRVKLQVTHPALSGFV
jgi:hypothetical protein